MKGKWLIRTRSGQIKGPIQKEQLVDLVKNDRLDQGDEICSGNGHWFAIKETEYLETYLYGDEQLEFNPLNTAAITLANSQKETLSEDGEDLQSQVDQDTLFPDKDDLEYPH